MDQLVFGEPLVVTREIFGVASQDRTLHGLSIFKRLFLSELLVAEQFFLPNFILVAEQFSVLYYFQICDGLTFFVCGLTFLVCGLTFLKVD